MKWTQSYSKTRLDLQSSHSWRIQSQRNNLDYPNILISWLHLRMVSRNGYRLVSWCSWSWYRRPNSTAWKCLMWLPIRRRETVSRHFVRHSLGSTWRLWARARRVRAPLWWPVWNWNFAWGTTQYRFTPISSRLDPWYCWSTGKFSSWRLILWASYYSCSRRCREVTPGSKWRRQRLFTLIRVKASWSRCWLKSTSRCVSRSRTWMKISWHDIIG